MNLKKTLLALLVLCFGVSKSQIKRKVLFIGNSYTYVNNLPQLITDIALSKGDTLVYDQSVIGGFTFQNHWSNSATYTKIKSNNWDVVVIQGQSQEPSFSPSQVMSQSYPYAKNLADSVRAANPCTEVMYYMTWGRKNGDASNCAVYAPVCTFAGMNARLRQSYLMFADSFNASCAPVGVAWKTYRNLYPSIDLYQADESHPSAEGSYLAGCVFYSSIFKKNVIGATYYFSLNTTDAQNMQTVGGNTVMDSTWVWNLNSQIPTANFTYSLVGGSTYQFNNTSVNATTYNWSFGSNQTSPQNTFAGSPPYTVTLTATNGCTTSATSKVISLTGISKNESCNSSCFYYDNELKIKTCSDLSKTELTIYDIGGRRIKTFAAGELSNKNNISFLQKGIYFLKLSEEDKTSTFKIIKD